MKKWKNGGKKIMKTKYDFISEIEELLDKALNTLEPDDFNKLLDDIDILLADYQ